MLVLFLTLAGIFLFFSILFQFMRVEITPVAEIISVLSVPGAFLYSTFLWAGFFIPVFLFLCAFFLASPQYDKNILIILASSIVPFLTVSILLKVADVNGKYSSALTENMAEIAGRGSSIIILILILLIELVLIYRLYIVLLYERKYSPEDKLLLSDKRKTADADYEDPDASGFEFGEIKTEWEKEESSTGGIPVSDKTVPAADAPALVEAGIETEIPGGAVNIAETKTEIFGDAETETETGTGTETETEIPGGTGINEESDDAEVPFTEKVPVDLYSLPVQGILKDYPDGRYWEIDEETRDSADILMKTLEEFKIKAEVTGIRKGPVITMFEILPAHGVKISKIVNLADNIALRLAALRVRIVAPIPGKHAVGIEVPNRKRNIVSFKELITLPIFKNSKYEIPIVLGKDIAGEAQVIDLVQTPHLLIAGATGSGKSVCVNSIINSILYQKPPHKVRLMLIDPKIVELKFYNDIPHLLTPVITSPKRAYQALQYCIDEMERRYTLLDSLGVRDIRSYNRRVGEQRLATEKLPYLVIVVDEFADLMATSGKEIESTLARLAAMSRAVGLHLVLATQRPSIDVITGLIKANIPSRIAFMVASKFDSRIIIDSVGAEKLLGKGDMLFSAAWDPVPIRIQGAFLSEDEVDAVTEHLRSLGKPDYIDDEIFFDEEEEEQYVAEQEDPLMERALEIVFTAGKASASFLQRRLKIGYNRAARLVEEMERRGIVGPQNGSKPREIIRAP
ncbi:MAG: DNA translocase FtsK [Spirochaetes bacterium]|nr:DNA translocase FtsK [Spirochaetota bacterium]